MVLFVVLVLCMTLETKYDWCKARFVSPTKFYKPHIL